MRVSEIVVPHDLTPLSDHALDALRALGIAAARVHVVHVLARIDPNHPALVWSRDEDEPRRAHAHRSLRARLLGTNWPGAQIHVLLGDPGSRIVELAKEVGADLVAMPSHGRKGLERFVFGSVAEHVVRFAPCPVLILPAAALEEGSVVVPRPVVTDAEPDEQVAAMGVEVGELVARSDGHLSALRIGLPWGQDSKRWEDALDARLGACGIEFVDLAFTSIAGPAAVILDARFEPLPVDR